MSPLGHYNCQLRQNKIYVFNMIIKEQVIYLFQSFNSMKSNLCVSTLLLKNAKKINLDI
jgi:hypothetical protein